MKQTRQAILASQILFLTLYGKISTQII